MENTDFWSPTSDWLKTTSESDTQEVQQAPPEILLFSERAFGHPHDLCTQFKYSQERETDAG